ncbi:type II toxin-antitoxin system CcdA family antitoxin [Methylophilus sp. TWE2]|uniref:type II toxin-antitoxin system CcdA family antitoxin n=1 Tax=Methylophilus sp. TWE2 TaxID=1662285 RepID=UPI0006717526|nr:type II toxin-antitoxin system CcdA family antitoxin [Methylophilus sp. TWE2]AKR44104.1 acetoacetyl-CoA synthase [Methylophilus sp. TWE2]
MLFNPQAPKRATNLSVNSDLLRQARELDINLSAAFEETLSALVVKKKQQAWLEQNKHAIEVYNQQVEANGVFGDTVRTF